MSMPLHTVGVEDLRRGAGWFIAIGICLIILGVIAIGYAPFVTLASMLIYGWLLVVGGLMLAVHGFWRRRWSGFFIDMLCGLLYALIGIVILSRPGIAAVALTLIIAIFLIFAGIFRIITALSVRYGHWIWLLMSGLITTVLGISIWNGWPWTGFWVIGLFIGVEMVLNGCTLVALGMSARRVIPAA